LTRKNSFSEANSNNFLVGHFARLVLPPYFSKVNETDEKYTSIDFSGSEKRFYKDTCHSGKFLAGIQGRGNFNREIEKKNARECLSIERAVDSEVAAINDMGIDLCCLDISMPE
jgi:hypothetical protein